VKLIRTNKQELYLLDNWFKSF